MTIDPTAEESGERPPSETLKSAEAQSTTPMPFLPLDVGSSTLDALAILAVAIGIAGVAILILFSKGHV